MRNFGQTVRHRAMSPRLLELPRDEDPCPTCSVPELRETNATIFMSPGERGKAANRRQVRVRRLVADLDREFRRGAVASGAKCSPQLRALPFEPAGVRGRPFASRDFRAVDEKTGLRTDWMGSDAATRSRSGKFRCRALHRQPHAARLAGVRIGDAGARKVDRTSRNRPTAGRLLRNISLLSVWATAVMHNNAWAELWAAAARRHGLLSLVVRGCLGRPLPTAPAAALRSERRGPFQALQGIDAAVLNPRADSESPGSMRTSSCGGPRLWTARRRRSFRLHAGGAEGASAGTLATSSTSSS